MQRKFLIAIPVILTLFFILRNNSRHLDKNTITAEIETGNLTLWSTYEGVIQARRIENIMPEFSGGATLVNIVQEGTFVKKGDILARFDSAKIKRNLLGLERDFALAESKLKSMEHAELPIEINDMETKKLEITLTLETEKDYLKDSMELLHENLVSESEIKQQQLKVEKLEKQLESIDLKLNLTRKFLHPSSLKQAKANMASSKQELDLARLQLTNSIIKAPVNGIVAYKQLYVGSEFRTIRIGDTIYQNQIFMVIPDMTNLVVKCNIPEAELSKIRKGMRARITPLAYPYMNLSGLVESVASMAQPVANHPNWQKYFHVIIAIKDNNQRLRTGMSAHTYVLSYYNPNTLLIPRSAVVWQANKPFCKLVKKSNRYEIRKLSLGKFNETHYEIISGLKKGDKVILKYN